jgi:hypothetical protein
MKRLLSQLAVAGAFLFLGGVVAFAQQAPNTLVGGVYNSTPATLADKQQTTIQLDANGNLRIVCEIGCSGSSLTSAFGDPFPSQGIANGFKDPSNNMAPGTLNADGGLEVHLLNGGSGGTSSTFGATFPTLGTAAGMSDGTNMVPFTSTDGTSLDVNCVTGCSGGGGTQDVNIVQIGGNAVTTTVPVSGTVTVTNGGTFPVQAAQSGTWDINDITGTISLPTGAATAANQTNASQKTQIVDGSGNVISSTSNNLNVQCANCSGSGASATDEASFTAGSSVFAPAGGFYQTTATSNPLTNGQQGFVQMTAQRALFSNLRDSSGTEIGTGSDPIRVDPTGSTTQPVSGTVTANAGTGNFTVVQSTASSLKAQVTGAGSAGTPDSGVVTVQGVTSGTPLNVSQSPATSGGLALSRAVLANSTNATVVKASAGQLYSISAFGISAATPAWIKFYNTSSSPTCNSSTVVAGPFLIPANTLGAGLVWNNTLGLAFSTGISYCVTAGVADNDNTAVAASTYTVTLGYK